MQQSRLLAARHGEVHPFDGMIGEPDVAVVAVPLALRPGHPLRVAVLEDPPLGRGVVGGRHIVVLAGLHRVPQRLGGASLLLPLLGGAGEFPREVRELLNPLPDAP